MAKLTLTDVASGYDVPTTTNANNDLVEAAIENTLSRDGTAPNSMESQLDMNSYKVINVAPGTAGTDAVNVNQLTGQAAVANTDIDSMTDVTITAAAKGDLLVFNGTAWVDLTVGANDELLTADSAEATGIKWAAPAAGAVTVAYKTINCPAGTDPVAGTATDTLNLATGDAAELTITGDSGTDTVTFALSSVIARTDESTTWTGQFTASGTTTFSGATTRFTGTESVDFQVAAYSRETNLTISSGTCTINADDANSFDLELTENVTTITLNNMNDGQGLTILISQDAGGANTVAFPAGWKWSGGTAGVVSSGANEEDILSLQQFNSVVYASLIKDFS